MKKPNLRSERQLRRRSENKETILHAAEAVILRKGCSAATMDDVAREAQFSKATLYKYFRNKGELVLEILLHYFEDLRDILEDIRRERVSAAAKLRAAILAFLEFQEGKKNISRVIFMDPSMIRFLRLFMADQKGVSSASDKKFLGQIQARRQELFSSGALLLREGVEAGEFRPVDVDQALLFIDACIVGYGHEQYWPGSFLSPSKAVDNMMDFLLHGIENKDRHS